MKWEIFVRFHAGKGEGERGPLIEAPLYRISADETENAEEWDKGSSVSFFFIEKSGFCQSPIMPPFQALRGGKWILTLNETHLVQPLPCVLWRPSTGKDFEGVFFSFQPFLPLGWPPFPWVISNPRPSIFLALKNLPRKGVYRLIRTEVYIVDRVSLLTSLGVFWFWMVWDQDPKAELGKLEHSTPESRLYLLGGGGGTSLRFSHTTSRLTASWLDEPHLLLGVLSPCSANHTSWVATPPLVCKIVILYPRRRQLHCFAPELPPVPPGGLAELVSPPPPGASESPDEISRLCHWLNQSDTNKKHGIQASPWQGAPALDLAHSTSVWCLQNCTCCFADGRAGGKKNHHLNSWKERRKES